MLGWGGWTQPGGCGDPLTLFPPPQERDQLLAMVERLQDQVARLEAGVGGAPAPPLAQLLEGVDALHLPPSPDPDP